MNKAAFLTVACLAALPAWAADDARPCPSDPLVSGMQERVNTMRAQIERVPMVLDREARERLLELHAKHMREGMQELRKRRDAIAPGCRMELMQALMEQMVAHQTVAHELDGR